LGGGGSVKDAEGRERKEAIFKIGWHKQSNGTGHRHVHLGEECFENVSEKREKKKT